MTQYYAQFIEYCKTFGRVPDELQAALIDHCTTQAIRKGDYYLRKGSFAEKQGFLVAGIMRHYITDEEGNERTSLFLTNNDMVGDIESCMKGEPANVNIQALTDSVVLSITLAENQVLAERYPEWESIGSLMVFHFLNSVIGRKDHLLQHDAMANYLHFLRTYPAVINTVPLNMVASYLGITLQSLSRIRRQALSVEE